jgi:hypothetical protein
MLADRHRPLSGSAFARLTAALHANVSYRRASGPAPMLTEWLKRVVKTHWQFPEADIQLHRIVNDSKATCSRRTAAERRASAKAE